MKFVLIGAGAMGGSIGGFLSRAGSEVVLIDVWQAHVDSINRDGLRIEGVLGEHNLRVPARVAPEPEDLGSADVAIIFVDSNSTSDAATTAKAVLKPDGYAVTFQNGIGNVEALTAVLGEQRVLGGSSMCSAASRGPGHVALTHLGPTSIGELDGRSSERVTALLEALAQAGFEMQQADDIIAKIWTKLVINVGVNAICATTGLRMGEVTRLPELDALQDAVLDEALQVVRAKGVAVDGPAVVATIKQQCQTKFSKPSMLQHIEAGRKTEIDAINGALVREGKALSLALPYNEALVALLKGREIKRVREVHEPDLDYAAWERKVNA